MAHFQDKRPHMPRTETFAGSSRVFTLVLVIAVITVLYLAKEVLVPFALALLLSFLLAPWVRRLERLRIGRVASVVTAVALTFSAAGLIGWTVADQLVDLARNLKTYQANITTKIEALKSPSGPLGRLQSFGENLMHPLGTAEDEAHRGGMTNETPAPTQDVAPARPPVPVPLVEQTSTWLAYLLGFVTPTLSALAHAGVVLVFVIFMLIQREDLRNRLIRLIGSAQINATTQAFDEASSRLSRYLTMQLIVNACYGCTLALGLYLIGLPNAVLWGLLAGMLRYIPYVGPAIAAIIPISLSLAAFDSWSYPLMTIALFVVLELFSANVMEPWLYGSTTGISTIGLLMAAVFWTWLWGAVGLVLATPLTVCIAVMGRYVPRLAFFDVLLSDEAALPPSAHLYQRLLAGDHDEAARLVEKQFAQGTLLEVYDQVLLPALVLLEQDAHRGGLDEGKLQYLRDSVREMVDELAERAALATAAVAMPPPESEPEEVSGTRRRKCVVCLPARDESDEIAALMLTHLLVSRGRAAQHVSVQALASEMLDQVAEQDVPVVLISSVPPFTATHTRYLCKRMRARFPDQRIVIGLWTSTGGKSEERLRTASADKIVTTLPQALENV
jgi:predicted PurR-regulated permease PerM